MSKIPFNRPRMVGNEIAYIKDAIRRGQLAGDGYYTERCQDLISAYLGGPKALLTHSCTAALEMTAILLNIGDGDEIIMPSFTFVSTANAYALRGGTPVFVDIDPETLCITAETIAPAITSSTRAICVVHYAGVSCDMDPILKLADQHGLPVVEDAAQALGASYKKRRLGAIGAMSCFSFHETKNIISGEGGALIINDEKFAARAEITREKGTNRKQFFRGERDKYSWVDIGSSFLPGELTSAFLLGQLEEIENLNDERRSAWDRYWSELSGYKRIGVGLPFIPDYCMHNAHLFYLLLPSKELRNAFISQMRSQGVLTPFHYVPLHSSPAGRKLGRSSGDLSVTDDTSDRLVRLPLYPGVSADQDRILAACSDVLDMLL